MRVEPDIVYDKRQPTPLALDLFLPDDTPPRGAILFAHGGGFFKGARKSSGVTDLAEVLTAKGYVLASASYRLGTGLEAFPKVERRQIVRNRIRSARAGVTVAPRLCGSAFEAARRDLGTAVGWLKQHLGHLGAERDKVGVIGLSAGGIAGLSLAFPPKDLPHATTPDAVLAISACLVQPWRLRPDAPPCLLLNNDRDRIIKPENPRLTLRRAASVGAPVKGLWCDRKGHNAPFRALLEDRDTTGRPFQEHMFAHFDQMF